MVDVEEILEDLEGNGFNQVDLLEVSAKLNSFSNMREELYGLLERVYEEEDLLDILGVLNKMSADKSYAFKYLSKHLTDKEKEAYILHEVQKMSMQDVGNELGVSKGTVQTRVTRARMKLNNMKIKSLGKESPSLHKVILKNSPDLPPRLKEYYKMYYVEEKSASYISKSLGVSENSVMNMVQYARSRVTIPDIHVIVNV